MKKTLVSIVIFLFSFSSNAFHIVGGELEFIHLADGLYRINVILYFDEVQEGNPNTQLTPADPFAFNTTIFRNSDAAVMTVIDIPLIDVELVPYTKPECAIERLVTSRAFYSIDIALDPNEYDDPEGYYIVWERFSRNSVIDNIINPSGTGMKYVLEIPPLQVDGRIFKNSSPVLFKPLSDYACINQLYYTEFTGVDPDGDSLVYSLDVPYNSSASVATPTPQPKPHIEIVFAPGFSKESMIPGSTPLQISPKGLLTVAPSQTGLFVFAIKIEEYRGGDKIGETRREFQMLVVDGCDPPDPPESSIQIPGNPDFDPKNDVLFYEVVDPKCFDFLVTNVTDGETITLRAEGVNFDGDLDEIFQLNQIPVSRDSLIVEVCIPNCPPLREEPFILDLIAGDDACPLPQLDTVRLQIQVASPPNNNPFFDPNINNLIVDEDSFVNQKITGFDADLDSLELSLFVPGVEDPTTLGLDFEITRDIKGEIEGLLSWNTDCTIYDFSTLSNFQIGLVLEDQDTCRAINADTTFIIANVVLPPNTAPVINDTNIPNEIDLGELLEFDVSAFDTDGDSVTLALIGGNFNTNQYTITFESALGIGNVSSNFSWDLACDASLFEDGEIFDLLFIADDIDKCQIQNFDTLFHRIKINYPENVPPTFSSINQSIELKVNEPVRIAVEAIDLDGDNITLSLADGVAQPRSSSLSFIPSTGLGSTTSFIEWTPECELIRSGETTTTETITLQVVDDACPISNVNTLSLIYTIEDDSERRDNFLPPNVFTPNNDGKNDTFRLSGHLDINQNLPPDNCDNIFEYIHIVNRSGNQVFRSEVRDFVWTGNQFPAGVYYYIIKYTSSDYKGYIQLIR